MSVVTTVVVLYFVGVNSEILKKPENFPCKKYDITCIKDMVQWVHTTAVTGDPGKKESSDPMFEELIEGNLGYVKYKLSDNKVQGFKTCQVTEAGFNYDFSRMHLTLLCPQMYMDGYYDINGSIINYPIRGNGTYTADITNYKFLIYTDVGPYKKNGNVHAKLKSLTLHTTLLGKAKFELQNLFNGKNRKLSDAIHKFGHDNARLFASYLDKPYFNRLIKNILNNYNHVFEDIPVKDLIDLDDNDFKTIE